MVARILVAPVTALTRAIAVTAIHATTATVTTLATPAVVLAVATTFHVAQIIVVTEHVKLNVRIRNVEVLAEKIVLKL